MWARRSLDKELRRSLNQKGDEDQETTPPNRCVVLASVSKTSLTAGQSLPKQAERKVPQKGATNGENQLKPSDPKWPRNEGKLLRCGDIPEAEPSAARCEPEVTSGPAQTGELPFMWPRKVFTKPQREVQRDEAKKKCLFAGLVFSQDMLMDSVPHVHSSQDRRKCARLHPV